MFPTNVLNALTYPLCVWYYYVAFLAECFCMGVCFFSLFCCYLKIFLMAHLGYLHWPSTCSRCFNSSSTSFRVEQIVCALYDRVLITLYLAAILWLLSHGRYRSVCVGFLYTPIVKVPSASGLMVVSRKGTALCTCLAIHWAMPWLVDSPTVSAQLLLCGPVYWSSGFVIFCFLWYFDFIKLPGFSQCV